MECNKGDESMKPILLLFLFLLMLPFVNSEIYPEPSINVTKFPIDYFRYGNEVSTGHSFTPLLVFFISLIIYFGMSGENKQRFAATGMIYGILGVLTFLAGLSNGFWMVTYVVAFALSIVALIIGKQT